MSKRPNPPEQSFLHRIGIFHIPENIDLTFDDREGHLDRVNMNWVSPRAFHITKVDNDGQPLLKTIIPAFETAARTQYDIWTDLKETLIEQYDAIPVHRPHHPTPHFLEQIGIAKLPMNIDLTFRETGADCARAFIIQKLGLTGQPVEIAEIPARDTRAYNRDQIWEKLSQTLVEQFGAIPAGQQARAPELRHAML